MFEILLQNLHYSCKFHSSGIINTPECGPLKYRYIVLKSKNNLRPSYTLTSHRTM